MKACFCHIFSDQCLQKKGRQGYNYLLLQYHTNIFYYFLKILACKENTMDNLNTDAGGKLNESPD